MYMNWDILWDDELECHQLCENESRVIADIYFQDLVSDDQSEAIRLIAAAPELLAALKDIVKVYKDYPDESAYTIAQAAIKKAKGE